MFFKQIWNKFKIYRTKDVFPWIIVFLFKESINCFDYLMKTRELNEYQLCFEAYKKRFFETLLSCKEKNIKINRALVESHVEKISKMTENIDYSSYNATEYCFTVFAIVFIIFILIKIVHTLLYNNETFISFLKKKINEIFPNVEYFVLMSIFIFCEIIWHFIQKRLEIMEHAFIKQSYELSKFHEDLRTWIIRALNKQEKEKAEQLAAVFDYTDLLVSGVCFVALAFSLYATKDLWEPYAKAGIDYISDRFSSIFYKKTPVNVTSSSSSNSNNIGDTTNNLIDSIVTSPSNNAADFWGKSDFGSLLNSIDFSTMGLEQLNLLGDFIINDSKLIREIVSEPSVANYLSRYPNETDIFVRNFITALFDHICGEGATIIASNAESAAIIAKILSEITFY